MDEFVDDLKNNLQEQKLTFLARKFKNLEFTMQWRQLTIFGSKNQIIKIENASKFLKLVILGEKIQMFRKLKNSKKQDWKLISVLAAS